MSEKKTKEKKKAPKTKSKKDNPKKLGSYDDSVEERCKIIEKRFASFDKEKIDLVKNPILGRITYIVFPVWEFEKLAQEYQDML